MISLTDCKDMCSATSDELEAIEIGGHVSLIDACALTYDADKTGQNRKALQFMDNYLRYVESHDTADGKRSHEVHETINHFARGHSLV
ncbi:MAG: hypothetical protein R3F02_21590 [Thiolinea sp.]